MNRTAQKQSRTLLYYVHLLLTRAGSATQDKAGKDLTARCAGTPKEEVGKVQQTPHGPGGFVCKAASTLATFFQLHQEKKSPVPSSPTTGAFHHFFWQSSI